MSYILLGAHAMAPLQKIELLHPNTWGMDHRKLGREALQFGS